MPLGLKGSRITTSLPSLASSRASLYIPLGSAEVGSTQIGPSHTAATSRIARRYSTPAVCEAAEDSHTPSKSPQSRIFLASSTLALSRKKRMGQGILSWRPGLAWVLPVTIPRCLSSLKGGKRGRRSDGVERWGSLVFFVEERRGRLGTRSLRALA